MTLVRERRLQQALRLSVPPPSPTPGAEYLCPLSLSLVAVTSPDSPNIDNLSDLEKLGILGHGNSGTVYKVRHKPTASIFALKILRFDPVVRQQAAREAEILKRVVDSPYIVRCHAVFDSEVADLLYFAMEHMERGSLYDVLLGHKILPEDIISGVAHSVLNGLRYLHGMNIVHGDIKPSNLLLNAEGDVKIADFGVSRIVVRDSYHETNYMGTCAYMSPERIDPERWGADADGFAGDVWSLGVVILECLVGHYPLIGCGEKPDWAALVCAICFGDALEMPNNASTRIQSFVKRCLEKDWRKRANVDELLHHPFVTQI